MKSLIFTVLLFISTISLAQETVDYLGMWSFKELDRSAMESIDEDKIKMVTNMFQNMKLNFIDDSVYEMQFMGENNELAYSRSGDTLLLDKGDKLILLGDDSARMDAGNSRLLFVKGDITVEKSYEYLTETEYEMIPFNKDLLIGEWKVEEVRAQEGTEGAELFEMIGKMITFNFITEDQIALGVSGMQTVEKYEIDPETQELVFKKTDADDSRIYILQQVTKDYIYAKHIKEGTLFYFVRKE
ncbi:MAG: hypothetical protein ACSHWW_02480 [Nonlabens sp.]|uniref:hypothetical protein n=1 Tax=Nonlabens sp. TaxID=1888209 RepID=UPI003EF223AB